MSKDGIPEPAVRRCGELIARLRTARDWSRARLVTHLYQELDPDDPHADSISESWLARLETGRLVKLPRQTMEALCRALRCTPRERAQLLLYADRNVLAGQDGAPTPAAELLNYVMDRLYVEAHSTLDELIAQHRGRLDEPAIFAIVDAALHGMLHDS